MTKQTAVGVALIVTVAGLASQAQGIAAAPLLVVVNDAAPNPFGRYLPEILRAEGITSFDVVQLAAVDGATLNQAKLVVVAETPLSDERAALFTAYVAGGGRLVAMRPDPRLHDVLGIAAVVGSTPDGYTAINQAGPGVGLQSVTLPIKGVADHYAMAGASEVAALYSTRDVPANRPAVVRHNRTAAWAFDLARSVAYTRQGDPAIAGLDRDGTPGYVTSDIFFQAIDLDRLHVPHADVQMRLFSRVITDLLVDSQPLPRLWYFPGTARTLLVATADSHSNDPAAYAGLIDAVEAVDGRISLYLPRFLDLAAVPTTTWAAAGHELGFHPYFAADGIPGDFAEGYSRAANWFATALPGVTPGPTTRHHGGEWGGWVDPVAVMNGFSVRMNLDYYSAGPALDHPTQAQQAHGYINGSGLPMRFVNAAGQVQPVYQQSTTLSVDQLIYGDHSQNLTPAEALEVSRQLIDASQAGGYSAVGAQFQVEYYLFDEVKPWVDGTLAYAAGQQVPVWSAERWLAFVEARAATTLTDQVWDAATGQLSLTVTVPSGAEPQSVLVPATFGGKVLANVTIDGQTTAPSALNVNGRESQVVQVPPVAGGAARQLVVKYELVSALPTVSIADRSVTEGDAGSAQTTLTVTLSASSPTDVVVGYSTSDGTATAGTDYLALASGVVIVPAGATSAEAAVTVLGDRNYEADETVVVRLANPVGATLADATAALTIVNDEPIVAVADAYATAYVTPLQVPAPGVLANDNANGQPGLTAVLIAPPAHGSLTLAADGGFTYTPAVDFAGIDTFTYRSDTAVGTGNVVSVAISVAEPLVVQAPRSLRAADIAGNVVTFRWTIPPRGPRPTGFVVEGGVAPGQPLVALATGPAPVFRVTAPNGSFHVRVRALGVGGPSTVSNEIPIHVGVPVPPSAPAVLQASVVGSSVFLAWTPTFAGGPPAGFVLDVGGSLAAAVPLPAVERLSFAGAPSGTFTLSMRAVNAGGSSPSTAAVQITVPGTCGEAPAPPTDLLGYVAGGTTFLLWDPPLGGGAATGYVVSVPGIGSLPLGQRSVSGPLPRGTHTINVHSVGPCGTSAPATTTVTVP